MKVEIEKADNGYIVREYCEKDAMVFTSIFDVLKYIQAILE